MSLNHFAGINPDKPAVIIADTGESISFRDLNDASAALARRLRINLDEGDRVAILLPNGISYFIAAWAARRAGLRYVPINWHLLRDETAYIVDNSDARVVISNIQMREIASYAAGRSPSVRACYSMDESFDGFLAMNEGPEAPAIEEREGVPMFYSSGTTGAPKGILQPLPNAPFGQNARVEDLMAAEYGFDADSIYLSPAPLYHAAPLAWTMGTQTFGGTAIAMRNFDAEGVLAAIDRYRVTHAQFVPTHFIRMLKLPEAVRSRYDLSSVKLALHAAAPCPAEVKEQMLDWWGPVIEEYYGASEGGFTCASAQEWRERPGTVGQSRLGPIHILDDSGTELPIGEIGTIFFEGSTSFSFHKEPGKTREHVDPRGWSAPGDLGYIDADGYLFLADRKSNMIISGGVNIYPQEAENVLALHPDVSDVAVIGIPHPDFGEEVKGVVVPAGPLADAADLEARLIAYCRERLAHFKCPRSIDFVDDLPRLPTGKLRKRELIERYASRT
jgi:acyl-CoA synthetase (AMP-forming)/AMP-acid ligase II